MLNKVLFLSSLTTFFCFFVSLCFPYWHAGTDSKGNPYIYKSINWQDNASGTQRLAFVLLFVAAPVVVLLFWWIYRCRSLAFGLEPGMRYVASATVGDEGEVEMELGHVSATKEMEEGGTTTTTTGADKS